LEPSADSREEDLTEVGQFAFAHAGNLQQRDLVAGVVAGHVPEGGIGKDDVGRDIAGPGVYMEPNVCAVDGQGMLPFDTLTERAWYDSRTISEATSAVPG
jgi:hypothetical protein